MTALELRDVVAGYKGSDVLRGVSLNVGPGEVLSILGPNGAGKSTLLRVISGQLRIRSGTRTVGGEDTTSLIAHQMARIGVRWTGDPRPMYPSLTIRENLQIGAAVDRKSIKRRLDWVHELLPALAEMADRRAGSLSGGQQQMVAIGQALMSGPKYLLLDEPSLGLAPSIVERVAQLVTELAEAGVGVVWAEQFPEVAIARSTGVLVVSAGRVALSGPPTSITTESLERAYLGLAKQPSA